MFNFFSGHFSQLTIFVFSGKSLSSSWSASEDLGTPGNRNSRFTVSINPDQINQPSRFQVSLAYPNPFNSYVTIPYQIEVPGELNMSIFDILGKQIISSSTYRSGAGKYSFHWDGKNNDGVDCASGMYIVRISQKQHYDNIKIALIR